MLGSKIQLDSASNQYLKTFKSRTGLTHQYTCRLAFCLSLAEQGAVEPERYDEKGLEFNRYTLTGEWDRVLLAYLREWLAARGDATEYDEATWFRAHVNRGLPILLRRVRTLADVPKLVPAK